MTTFRTIALLWVVVFSIGCAFYDAGEDISSDGEPFSGTVDREGEIVGVTLHRTWDHEFPEIQEATGFIETEDGTLIATVKLHFENFHNIPDGTDELPVGNAGEVSGHSNYGVGISWYENRMDDETSVVYEHGYREGDSGEVSGTFHVDDTDWQTFIHGDLEVQIDNSGHGQREIEMTWNWGEAP